MKICNFSQLIDIKNKFIFKIYQLNITKDDKYINNQK